MANAQKALVKDRLGPGESAVMTGFAGERLSAAYNNRIMAQDVNRLVEPFRNRTEASCWQSEFWGKWFTSAVLALRYAPNPALKAKLDSAVTQLLRTQTPDGYIGNYSAAHQLEAWDIWGRKYCMLGLISYFDLTNNIKSLDAARKIADHLMNELKEKSALIVKQGNHRGMAASSVLEPIVLLYNRTKDQRYLDFANEIVREWETPDGPQLISKASIDVSKRFPPPGSWFGWEQGQKAYEMMSCYEGLLELYRVTGNPAYKEAVEKTWANINANEINVAGSGSAVECWFGGKQMQTMAIGHYQETCVTATWIKLSQQLLRLTGEAKYADAIEQSWYNALLGSMHEDGADWAKYSPLSGIRLTGGEQCGMGLNCCVASGPRGLFTLPLTTVMSEQEGVKINFFAEGRYRTHTPLRQELQLVQHTDYPVSGKIEIEVSLDVAEKMTVSIRVPGWSQQSKVSVNGQPVSEAIVAGQYIDLKREWKKGDKIELQWDMRGRLIQMGQFPQYTAIVRGPILLARDVRLGGADVDQPALPVANKEGYIDLEPASEKVPGIWMRFKAPFVLESHKEGANPAQTLWLCDYLSAGNTVSNDSRFRVWIPQLYDARKDAR